MYKFNPSIRGVLQIQLKDIRLLLSIDALMDERIRDEFLELDRNNRDYSRRYKEKTGHEPFIPIIDSEAIEYIKGFPFLINLENEEIITALDYISRNAYLNEKYINEIPIARTNETIEKSLIEDMNQLATMEEYEYQPVVLEEPKCTTPSDSDLETALDRVDSKEREQEVAREKREENPQNRHRLKVKALNFKSKLKKLLSAGTDSE